MASPLSLRVDVDMSELIRAAQESGTTVENLGDAFRAVETEATAATSAAQTSLDAIDSSASAAATGVDGVATAAGTASGELAGLGAAAGQALSGDVQGGVSSALSSLAGMATSVGIGGPVGSAVLGALGELVGSLIAQLDLFGERAKAARDEVSNALVETGGAFDAADLKSRIQAVITDTDKWAAANTLARATGMDLGDVVAGLAGEADSARRLADAWTTASADVSGAWGSAGTTKELLAAEDALQAVTEGLGDAPAKTAAYNSAMSRVEESTTEATEAAGKLRDELMKPLTDPKVRYQVDDSAVRNWHPPMLTIPATVVVRPGQVQYTG